MAQIAIPRSVPAPKKKKEKKNKKEDSKPAAAKLPQKNSKKKKKKKGQPASALKDHRDDIEFIAHRLKVFSAIHQRQCAEREAMADDPITITLPDGKVKEGLRWKTTPLQIAQGISPMFAKSCIVAKVNGKLWDMFRPFEGDAELSLLKWDDDEAKEVFWRHRTSWDRAWNGC